MTTIYDYYFNQNEWYTIVLLVLGIFAVYKLKKIFTLEQTLIYITYSIFIGMIFDHTIGKPPFDFYDVNDSSNYEFFDFLTYITFGCYGYLYAYIYDRYKIKFSSAPLYILAWSFLSILAELMGDYLGAFHYKNGYKIFYSFPIYLFTFSILSCLYKLFNCRNSSI